jgi:hypothetical protein
MESLIIDEGLKSFAINNDENRVIKFNPSDMSILHRVEETLANVEKEMKKYENKEIDGESEKKFSKFICNQIDYIFNSKVADVVFNGTSPLSTIKGIPYYVRFIEAVKPIIEEEIMAERKASEEKIKKYTEKYKGSN